MKLAILVVARNQPDSVRALRTRITASVSVPHETFVVEWGTDPVDLSRASSLWLADDERRGEAFALNLALQAARMADDFDYVWVLRADARIEAGTDLPGRAIRTLEAEPNLGLLAPPDPTAGTARPGGGDGGWRPVATVAHPGFFLRAAALDEVGFLDPDFRLATGAIDELCFRLHAAGWGVAESDELALPTDPDHPFAHPAEEAGAQRFALAWLAANHGSDWDRAFWRAAEAHGVEEDRFAARRAAWERAGAGEDAGPPAGASPEPWPLATDATYLLFAWPDYDDPAELDALVATFVRPILGRGDVCLCLRHDAAVDGPQGRVVEALEQSFQRATGPSSQLEVLLVDDDLTEADWPRLGRSVTCVLPLPSSRREPRRSRLADLGAPVVATSGDLLAAIPGLLPHLLQEPRYTTDQLDEVDWELVARIKELHPWSHPVHVGNLAVEPGVGAGEPAERLARRTAAQAARLLFDVCDRAELRGRSVLELSAGCAYWSARYSERGAARVVAVESDPRLRAQAELYWSHNRFLPEDGFRLLDGDLSRAETWDAISALGPHDVTLCLGYPPEVRAREEFLRRATEVTRELLVLDLPGPVDEAAREFLAELGLEVEVLSDAGDPDRSTLLARRRVAEPPAALPAERAPRSAARSA